MNFKKGWKKFWHLMWKDQSLKGWIFAFAVLFIFIKFIFFPGLNFLSGTSQTLAIVESCSMYHDSSFLFFKDFDKWWENHEEKYSEYEITKDDFKKYTLKNGFNKGDILFSIRAKPDSLEIGDVILFDSGHGNPIIHRIINIKQEDSELIFQTIGDNNKYSLNATNTLYGINELHIEENQLIGKAVFKLAPYLGWGKLIFYDWQKPESERGLCDEN